MRQGRRGSDAAGAGRGFVSPARRAAWQVLQRQAREATHDEALPPEYAGLSERDRGLAGELVSGVTKRRASLDAVLGRFTKTAPAKSAPEVLLGLRLGAFQLLYLDRVPAHAAVNDAVELVGAERPAARSFVNAVLRRVAASGAEVLAELSAGAGDGAWAVRYSQQLWLIRLLRRELGDELAAGMLAAANEPPERCLRIDPSRMPAADAEQLMVAEGYALTRLDEPPRAALYEGPPLQQSMLFKDGVVSAQSRGSQLAGLIAAGGVDELLEDAAGGGAGSGRQPATTRLLDLCAAPGVKTAQLAALLPQAEITAVEVNPARGAVLRANLARQLAGCAGGVEVVVADALALPTSFDEVYDKVLVDAPCGGLGTLATRPDLRWRRQPSDVPRLAALQKKLLARAARCLRPGGTLTYVVCTVTRAETSAVVNSFLSAASAEWSLDDLGRRWPRLAHPDLPAALRIVPPAFGSSGFFVARLRRAG